MVGFIKTNNSSTSCWQLISLLQLQVNSCAADVTFLPETLPAVLTDVGLLPRVQLHVEPQGVVVGQQLGADCTLHLGE